jgi:hypothetical protein
LDQFETDVQNAIEREVATVAMNFEGGAKQRTPVLKKPIRIRGALYSGDASSRASTRKYPDFGAGPFVSAVELSIKQPGSSHRSRGPIANGIRVRFASSAFGGPCQAKLGYRYIVE